MEFHLRLALIALLTLKAVPAAVAADEPLHLNDSGYFETRGVNVLVFDNWYNGLFSDSKMSGIELVHHGVRTATNGDVRLDATPEQWDAIPEFVERKIDTDHGAIEAFLRYPDYDFDYSIRAEAAGDGVIISINLPKPLPRALAGKAGFNLEFLPAAYFGKSFAMDDGTGLFPLYPTGPKEQNGKVAPRPLASGHRLVLAPDDPARTVTIASSDTTIALYDGRGKAQNGWFVVRSLLPSDRTGRVLAWTVTPHSIDGWVRPPVIAHSQVGYHPRQRKVAVIELDVHATGDGHVLLNRVDENGATHAVLDGKPEDWGRYKRYAYKTFDFTGVRTEGIYTLEYGGVRTAPFRIAADVYDDVWHPTLDVYMPVQMDHVLVNEAYRVWHGASHLDDARQAPVNHEHFDLYAQGPTTDTSYKPGEHIPGLDVGGWYDAGDYDIRTQTQYSVVNNLVSVWETFRPTRDTTSVDYEHRYVDLHVPDGKPDVLQQIEHGTLMLVAQFHAVGHAIPGIIVPTLAQYTHLGDGMTMTDNLVYDPNMGETESGGGKSGVADDRWAFTSRSSALDYGSIAALAAASRVLTGYDDALAAECRRIAVRVWDEEHSHAPYEFRYGNTTGGPLVAEEMKAALELLVTTGEQKYADRFIEFLPEIEARFPFYAALAVRAIPYMDGKYKMKIRELALAQRQRLDEISKQNPFGALITEGGWAGNGAVIGTAIANYYLHQAFPDIIDEEDVFRGLNYLFGTHPDSDISFVSAVGARSKEIAYGMNRADYSFIAGGVVPGVLILKPDLPENKEDWPFLWGENEYVVGMGPIYIFLANAVDELLKSD